VREGRSGGLSQGRREISQLSRSEDFSIRVLSDGHQGIVTANTLNKENFPALCREARDLALTHPADPHIRFSAPPPSPQKGSEIFPIDGNADLGQIFEELKRLEEQILGRDRRLKSVVALNFAQEKRKKVLVNNLGLAVEGREGISALSAEVLAEEGPRTEVAWEGAEVRFKKDLPCEEIVDEVVDRALSYLGARPLDSGNYVALIHPRVGAQFLELIAEALSAEAVQNGRSFFEGRRQKKIAPQFVNLVDDPFLPEGVASALYDDEGVPTQKLSLLEEGVLEDYFFDLRSASRSGRESNGRGFRSKLSSLPTPSPTNLYLQGGSVSGDQMLSSEKKIFYLWDVMGLHMVDSATGEFSLGAAGALYEGGRVAHAVTGVTISGDFLDVLENIVSLGREVKWYGPYGAPHILVSKLAVGGA